MDAVPSKRRSTRPRTPTVGEVDRQLSSIGDVRTAVLVEGASDREALVALARLRNIDLAAHSTEVVPMGGITNIGRFVTTLGPSGRNVRLLGLCDAQERSVVVRALTLGGFEGAAVDDLESSGFFTCDRDLEDELIRALGVDPVESVLAGTNELASFRRFQRQPAQREVAAPDQLRRFLGTRATRKIRLASELIQAIGTGFAPPPLEGLLDRIASDGGR